MALVIEDGTNVPGATSLATVATFRMYASARGFTVPTPDAECEALLINAMDYLDSLEPRLKGWRTYNDQALSWPRTGISVEHGPTIVPVNPVTIPAKVVQAQCRLAVDAMTATLQPSAVFDSNVKREKVGPIETEFFGAADRLAIQEFTAAMSLLSDFMSDVGQFSLTLVRA